MDPRDQLEFFELLLDVGNFLRVWAKRDEQEIQSAVNDFREFLHRRDDRLRAEKKIA